MVHLVMITRYYNKRLFFDSVSTNQYPILTHSYSFILLALLTLTNAEYSSNQDFTISPIHNRSQSFSISDESCYLRLWPPMTLLREILSYPWTLELLQALEPQESTTVTVAVLGRLLFTCREPGFKDVLKLMRLWWSEVVVMRSPQLVHQSAK